METFTRKRGMNRGRPRLWIEGKHLTEAGFKPGDFWTLTHHPGGFTIAFDTEGKRKVSGKGSKPIIDIAGSSLGVVAECETVDCHYFLQSGQLEIIANA